MFVTALAALAAASTPAAAQVSNTVSAPPPIVRVTPPPIAAVPRANPNVASRSVAAPSGPKTPTVASSARSPVPDFAAMMKIFDKMFPPQPAPDPARLALARTTVETLWPNGTYGRMMGGMMGGMYDRVLAMKPSDFEELGGKKGKSDDAASDATLHELMLKDDPKFDEHATLVRQIMVEEFNKVALIVEPRLRGGLANAYARRFDARQLTDINAFFATDSGKALGSQLMLAWADSDVMRGIMSSMPEMMQAMPGIMARVQGAMAKIEQDKKAAKPVKK